MTGEKGARHLLAWHTVPVSLREAAHKPPTAEDVRQGRAWFSGKGKALEAVQLRPEDARALGVTSIDGLPIEPDSRVTPGMIFFIVAE